MSESRRQSLPGHPSLQKRPKLTKKEVKGLVEDVGVFKDTIAEEAERIISQVFPAKIVELNKILRTDERFASIDTSLVLKGIPTPDEFAAMNVAKPIVASHDHDDAGDDDMEASSKKRKRSDGAAAVDGLKIRAPVNKFVQEMLEFLKGEVQEMIDIVGVVKIWIQLNIPRIEDGNNFGVSIQEETVGELGRAEDSAFAVLEAMTKYFVTRAKLLSKCAKYPYMEDYRQALIELDEKEYINLKLCTIDLRNNYSILFDLIHKNLEKIKQPRGHKEPTLSMY